MELYGRDPGDGRTVDQNLDLLGLRLTGNALHGQEREVVRLGVQIDGLAHAGVVHEKAGLAALGGVGIAGGQALLLAADPGQSGELPGRGAGGDLVGR